MSWTSHAQASIIGSSANSSTSGINSSSQAQLQVLYQVAQSIDIARLGHLSGTRHSFLPQNVLDQLMRYVIAQAMLQGIGGGLSESALAIRDFIPKYDFVDGDGRLFENNMWVQKYGPERFDFETRPRHGRYAFSNIDPPYKQYQRIYQTNKTVNNDKKVIMIYGIEYLDDPDKRMVADEIQFWRKDVKLIDRFILPTYSKDKGFIKADTMYTPILYKKDEPAEIRVCFKDKLPIVQDEAYDRLKLLGFVCESLGVMTVG